MTLLPGHWRLVHRGAHRAAANTAVASRRGGHRAGLHGRALLALVPEMSGFEEHRLCGPGDFVLGGRVVLSGKHNRYCERAFQIGIH